MPQHSPSSTRTAWERQTARGQPRRRSTLDTGVPPLTTVDRRGAVEASDAARRRALALHLTLPFALDLAAAEARTLGAAAVTEARAAGVDVAARPLTVVSAQHAAAVCLAALDAAVVATRGRAIVDVVALEAAAVLTDPAAAVEVVAALIAVVAVTPEVTLVEVMAFATFSGFAPDMVITTQRGAEPGKRPDPARSTFQHGQHDSLSCDVLRGSCYHARVSIPDSIRGKLAAFRARCVIGIALVLGLFACTSDLQCKTAANGREECVQTGGGGEAFVTGAAAGALWAAGGGCAVAGCRPPFVCNRKAGWCEPQRCGEGYGRCPAGTSCDGETLRCR
jgi:hypothetical protein